MTSSIVLSTYNGEKFIISQLDSLRNQTLKADYVYISDDCSTDTTPELIKNYIKEYKLTNWEFAQNSINKGWEKQFYDLLFLANTDIVFLCDQDDIWDNNKLECMIPYFENQQINVLCCNQITVNSNDINKISIKELKTGKKCYPYKFSPKFLWVNKPGCTYAIRKTFLLNIQDYWNTSYPHDAIIFRNALLDDSLYYLDEILMICRLHDSNASIAKKENKYQINLNYYFEVCNLLYNRLLNDNRIPNKKQKIKILLKAKKWLNLRQKFYLRPNIFNLIQLIFYFRFYRNFKKFIKEFFIAYHTRKINKNME